MKNMFSSLKDRARPWWLLAIIGLIYLIAFALWVAMIYAAFHFISKFW